MSDPFEGIDQDQVPVQEVKKKKKAKKPTKTEKRIVDEHVKNMKPKEGVKERATLIYAIKAYGKSTRFKKYLKSQGKTFGETRLQKMNIEQLKLELETLDILISNRGNSDLIDTVVKSGISFAENIVDSRTKLKIKGTAAELFENDKFLDLLERVKLKYGMPSLNLDPALELAFVVFSTALAIHQSNGFKNDLLDDTIDLDEEVVKITTKNDKTSK
jgi:hypothetical protein